MTPGALSGIRILDLTDERGAYCGKLLADMGADVIKVEPPGGDAARAIGPFFGGRPHPDRSLFFWHYNTNKRSVALDPGRPTERSRFHDLAAGADVAVVTGTPSEIERRGLDWRTLAARHPHLVVAAISPFGQTGPRREWKSCDTVAQALGGMVFVNGHQHEPPLSGLGPQAYHSAAVHAAIGVLVALLARRRNGRGQLVDVSLQESVAAAVEHVSAVYHQSGAIEVRRGSLHWTRVFRVGRCKDGYVLLSHLGDWTSLVEWVKADGKARDLVDPVWEDADRRRDGCEHVFDVLDEWAGTYSVAELVEGAQLRRLPCAAVRSLDSLPAHPQLGARHFFVPLAHDELGRTLTYPGAPYRCSVTPWRLVRRAPLAGEHTAEVLEELTRPRRKAPDLPRGHRGQGTGDQRRVLEGIRVLDFTWVVAGPVATRVLADHGAEVIKIEPPAAADRDSRREVLTGNLNRGKRSVAINMADERGVALVRELVRLCDVVIDNFSRRVMANWGLDYDALRAIKPDVIAVSMSGFGATGPFNDRVSYGPTLHAEAGYTWHMRHPGGEPAGWGFSYSDMVSGYSAALAILMALWHRAETGVGQCIDLSQLEAVSAMHGPVLLDVLTHGARMAVSGNESPEGPAAPHGIYRCRDLCDGDAVRERWCAIAVFTAQEWECFVRVLGSPSWSRAPRFATVADRVEHQEELDARVACWTSQHSAEWVMHTLQAAGVAAGVVADAEDLCVRDAHLQAREYWTTVRGEHGDRLTFDGVPARLSATPGFVSAPGPACGEHTDEVLRALLGLEHTMIDRLRSDHVIA